MKISYLITCHNETTQLLELIEKLNGHIESTAPGDEVVILDDFSDNPDTVQILDKAKSYGMSVIQHKLDKNFAEHKNYGSKRCVGDFIFQIDADEYPHENLLANIHELVKSNPKVELYRVPRVNMVRGATPQDCMKWGWVLSDMPQFGKVPIINWPDYQSRIYKNSLKIQWKKKLHETIAGAEYVAEIPMDPDFAIIHDKNIERQRAQNEFYNKNWTIDENRGLG